MAERMFLVVSPFYKRISNHIYEILDIDKIVSVNE